MQQVKEHIDYNLLGTLYEQSLEKYIRKNDGIFYTPNFITGYICENTIGELCKQKKKELNFNAQNIENCKTFKKWLFDLKILDPACGSGAFLNAALDFLIKEHQQIDDLIYDLAGEKIRMFDTDKQILENNIFGVDINDESVDIAKLSLWLRTAKKDRKLSDLNDNIKCGNSLIDNPEIAGEKAFDWHKEFAEIMQNGGFDVVIGNPPYVRADIDKPDFQRQRRWMETCGHYETLYEKWDLMVAFYERSLKLLKTNGIHGYIVSNSITTSKYAFRLHEFILKKFNLISIDYFDDFEVFKGVGVVPVITIIQNKSWNLKVTKTTRLKAFQNKTVNDLSFNNLEEIKPIEIFKRQYDKIKLNVDCETLNNICYISKGMVINADEILSKGLFAKDDIISFEETKIHTKPFVEGKDLKDYRIERIKYLEWNTDRVPAKLSRKTFPELYTNEKLLRGRVTGAVFDNTGIVCNDGVIVFKRFCDLHGVNQLSITSSITKNNSISRNELENISEEFDLKYILAILNSTYAYWYLNNFRRAKVVNCFYPDDFRKLPIPKIGYEQQLKFIENVDKILLNYTKLKKSEMFLSRIKTHLNIKTITQKLAEFYKYDFKTFNEELIKQKIVLNLHQSDEWEEYFNSYTTELKTINKIINETKDNLNNMIYNLFHLSNDEIIMIQNATQ